MCGKTWEGTGNPLKQMDKPTPRQGSVMSMNWQNIGGGGVQFWQVPAHRAAGKLLFLHGLSWVGG